MRNSCTHGPWSDFRAQLLGSCAAVGLAVALAPASAQAFVTELIFDSEAGEGGAFVSLHPADDPHYVEFEPGAFFLGFPPVPNPGHNDTFADAEAPFDLLVHGDLSGDGGYGGYGDYGGYGCDGPCYGDTAELGGDVDFYTFTGLPAGTVFVAETVNPDPERTGAPWEVAPGGNDPSFDTVLGWFVEAGLEEGAGPEDEDPTGVLIAADDDSGPGLYSRVVGIVPDMYEGVEGERLGDVTIAVSGHPDEFGPFSPFSGFHSEVGDYNLSLSLGLPSDPSGNFFLPDDDVFGEGCLPGVFCFNDRDVEGGRVVVVDPDIAIGYEYEINDFLTDPDVFFDFIVPTNVGGDTEYTLMFFNPLTGLFETETVFAGIPFFFPFDSLSGGVRSFKLTDIDPALGLDPENEFAFPVGLGFQHPLYDTFDVSFIQTPLTVPEPATLAMFGTGLIGLAAAYNRRRRKKS